MQKTKKAKPIQIDTSKLKDIVNMFPSGFMEELASPMVEGGVDV